MVGHKAYVRTLMQRVGEQDTEIKKLELQQGLLIDRISKLTDTIEALRKYLTK